MAMKGAKGWQEAGDRAQEVPVTKAVACKALLGLGECTLVPTERGKEPGTQVGHPRAFTAPRFPQGPAGSHRVVEVGSGLVLVQPPRGAAQGGSETSLCVCLHQKRTRGCEPTHTRPSAPTRAAARTGTPRHAPSTAAGTREPGEGVCGVSPVLSLRVFPSAGGNFKRSFGWQ